VHHLVGRPRRGDNRIPGNLARRASPGAFVAEVRVSALQLLPSDTNPRSNRRRPEGLASAFRRPLAECRSPEALESPRGVACFQGPLANTALQPRLGPCKHVRALTCFRGPSLCLNQTPYPRASKACHTCLSTGRTSFPGSCRPTGCQEKNQKSVSSCQVAVTTLGDGSLVGQGKRRMHARDRLFWDIR